MSAPPPALSTGQAVIAARARFASDPAVSRGRLVPEAESPPRTAFARDRDRIIHSSAFRRLKHKTQVFVYHEGDHYRTRLTHSIEVAQIARSIARALGLDEDLTEALALAHDLGHTPFGHAGERELDALMKPYGGFDHNAQTLRIVTRLEHRYASFDGLNLTWETLEGLVKHNGPLIDAEGHALGHYRESGLPAAIVEYAEVHDLALASWPSAEAQVAALSDDIAYNAHDIDDGLRAHLFEVIDLGDVPLVGTALAEVLKTYPKLDRARLVHETVRRVISAMVGDLLAETNSRAARFTPGSADAVRSLGEPLVAFSLQMRENNRVLQAFLSKRMYRHERVLAITDRARRVIRDLFEAYMADPELLPKDWREDSFTDDRSRFARQVCDFIAGMTDRYALDQHKRLYDLEPLLR
ncbi:MAG: deoxyguanosinetriphosphate triphosphohydrolase [Rhizobiales bacterium]|nr:deoxyguanosinetriphosphate triphosphohydrolase [Hyphomicrobiales bacterium]